ncbi:MAG: peptidase E [Bacteroidetes bacterium]|nr:peptidase E [Bacteroidota bacterium]
MKTFKFVLLILLLPLLAYSTAHKFYVSVTQVEYIKEKQTVQIISRIFIDDFEELIRQRYDEGITLDTSKEEIQIDFYIERYLQEKIKIKINDSIQTLVFIGKEYEDDIIYCYLEIKNISVIKSFEITNQILFDLYDEQQNIVRTKINSKNKSFILISQNDMGVLNFN